MTASTRVLCLALIRLGKGALAECEKWVQVQPTTAARSPDAPHGAMCDNLGKRHPAPVEPVHAPGQ